MEYVLITMTGNGQETHDSCIIDEVVQSSRIAKNFGNFGRSGTNGTLVRDVDSDYVYLALRVLCERFECCCPFWIATGGDDDIVWIG